MKNNIHPDSMEIGSAVSENLTMRLAEVAARSANPNVAAKDVTIKITVKMKPSADKSRYIAAVTSDISSPAVNPFMTTIFTGVDKKTGEAYATDHDPNQYRLPFDGEHTPV